MSPTELWQRYQKYLVTAPSVNLSLDVSRMHFDEAFLSQMEPKMQKAFAAMDALERIGAKLSANNWVSSNRKTATPETVERVTKNLRAATVEMVVRLADTTIATKGGASSSSSTAATSTSSKTTARTARGSPVSALRA